jgi:hypothetical protein
MDTTDLILFSGGPDSTILLKYFLEQKKKVRVLYIEMGWDVNERQKADEQAKAVKSVLEYMYEKYGDFHYSHASIFASLNNPDREKYFAKDHEWCAFFGSMFCHNYNIPRMWTGNFSYTNEVVKSRDGEDTEDNLNGEGLSMWMECATKFSSKPAEYCTPRLNFAGKELDAFKTKKEAWDSLEMDLKKLVRSCISDQWYCGECFKCQTAQKYKLRDSKGNPL